MGRYKPNYQQAEDACKQQDAILASHSQLHKVSSHSSCDVNVNTAGRSRVIIMNIMGSMTFHVFVMPTHCFLVMTYKRCRDFSASYSASSYLKRFFIIGGKLWVC